MTIQSRIPVLAKDPQGSGGNAAHPLLMRETSWFVALLLALLLLSAIAPIGYMGGGWDDWRYLNAARCWREFGPCLPHDHWQSRWPLIAPLYAITAIAGESRLTVSLWPLTASFLALWFLALAGNRLLGRPVGWIAAFLLLLTPAFSLIMLAPRIESVELAAILGGVVAVLQWRDRREGRSALLAGLMFGVAIQARETAAIATGFAALYVLTRKPLPSPAHVALAAVGLAIPFAIEFLIFWVSTGDPLWRRRLDVDHTQILSSELHATPDPKTLPFFNKTYIANWHREMGIYVHWSIDGVLNLLANPRAGITLTVVPLVLLFWRKIIDAGTRRATIWLWAGAMLYVALLTYALAMDPKSRIMMVPVCAVHLAFALLSWRLIQLGRSGAVYGMWAVIALIGLSFPFGAPRIQRVEPSAREWIAAHRGDIEIEPNTRRQLTLLPEARGLPGLGADRRFLLYNTNNACPRLIRDGGLAADAIKLVASKSMSRLSFIPAPWGELCLFEYEKAVPEDAVRHAISRSRRDGPYSLAPRPEAIFERD